MLSKTLIFFFCFFLSKNDAHTMPNLIFIMADDQDIEMFGLSPMASTRRLLMEKGISFSNMFVTTPICCPSRSSILTGQYVHNQGTRNNSVEGGCSSTWWQMYKEPETFASYLKQAGYLTFYAGKYLNDYGHKEVGGPQHVPAGWDWWYGLVGNSRYYNYRLSVNGTVEKHGDAPEDYLTDLVNRKGVEFLDFAARAYPDRPLLLTLSTPAPHGPFTPAPEYQDRFPNARAPRSPNYNVHGVDKHWLVRSMQSPMTPEVQNLSDSAFRNRWRTLLSVDDLVADVVAKLEATGRLNNSYIIYTSDNGYHCGQFCMPMDKRMPYEFDIRVPLLIRGPGIAPSQINTDIVLNIDLAPTLLDLAGLKIPESMDGRSLLPFLTAGSQERRTPAWRKHFLLEYWGEGSGGIPDECPQLCNQGVAQCHPNCICEDSFNNTYSCIRNIVPGGENTVYCEFRDSENFLEAYNLNSDPYQLDNVAGSLSPTQKETNHRILQELTKCSGYQCP